jgi:hypothetical protein
MLNTDKQIADKVCETCLWGANGREACTKHRWWQILCFNFEPASDERGKE